MNERIKQLATEVGISVEYLNNTKQWPLIEALAERIVSECIERGNVLAKHYIDTHSEKEQAFLLASIADYSNEIKQHFGVEE